MAKLNAYYGLCPLVDHKNFIGISKDVVHGHVIVTQSKNIAIRYKLADQKQIQSWRTKDKFTSPVVFDNEENKYAAILNETTLRLWSQDEMENLDKIKKYKFLKPMHTIVNINNRTYIIFENGNILTLKDAMEQRKGLELKDIINVGTEKITDVKHFFVKNIVYICLIVKAESITSCFLTSFPDNFPHSSYHRMELKRDNIDLAGCTFCLMCNKYLHFLTLWSNGQLYSYLVAGPSNEETLKTYTEAFGEIYATIESVSCKESVAMIPINNDHIAMYGADSSQEGASVVIYNTQFKILQSKQPFKMFSNITKLWQIDNVLLLCSGRHLAVIPFEINTEHLSQLVGSHKINVTDVDVQQIYTVEKWDIDEENDYDKSIPTKIRQNVWTCLEQGLSETTTSDMLIPSYIESSDKEAIQNCLDYFKDISEESIVRILAYLIETSVLYNDEGTPITNDLVNKTLSLPFTNLFLLLHVKAYLNINQTLSLLKYISFLFLSENCLPELDYIQTEGKLIEWGCVLLDGNYQKFLLTRDTIVHETLKDFNVLVQERLLGLSDLQNSEAVISDFVKRKCISSNKEHTNNYSVEQIKLY
ncbi:hypothetical protein MML48_1g02835 [Holotrichia oblita]|uniref:Uncharacterized protein n=1 Tax=Holotrichia oblita TaxID=644536 RepID=A0ACB9TTK0_HOLOL|nr:hypothetical protein MML48_1g02835 [Holotrichia oblita]